MSKAELYNGKDDLILLQGFHWRSHESEWYKILVENASKIQHFGFDYIWLPPCSVSVDKQGYLPTEWYNLNSNYGSGNQLKQAIAALRSGPKAVEAIADIVVNHRCGLKDWADFQNPSFAPAGTTDPAVVEQANQQAVVQEDEWKHAGGRPAGGTDTGEQFNGGRDLDHTNPVVQRAVIAWLKWLREDIGFVGWRWDLVKGYHPRFVGLYNDATQPAFSVAEFTEATPQGLADWINRSYGQPDDKGQPDRTGGKSCAFDFALQAALKKALTEKDYAGLKTAQEACAGLIGVWPSMAVTFLDNHDTEPANHNDPFPTATVIQGYAYLMTHPGKPCVFWCHLFDWEQPYREAIEALTGLRRQAGLHAQSVVRILAAEQGLYAAVVDEKAAIKIGPAPWNPKGDSWSIRWEGHDLAVWIRT
jgi:alpha-amylase